MKKINIAFLCVLCAAASLSGQNTPTLRKGEKKDPPRVQTDKRKTPVPASPKREKQVPVEKQQRAERPERPPRPDMPRMERMENISRNHYGYGRKSTPPSRSRMVYHSGVGYRYYKGVYYKPYMKGEWVISRPPIGVVVAAVMLEKLSDVVIPRTGAAAYGRYYYDDGVFYVKDPTNNYRVVAPPVGVLVDMLPSGCERVTNGVQVYFVADGYRYTPVSHEGRRMYRMDGRVVR